MFINLINIIINLNNIKVEKDGEYRPGVSSDSPEDVLNVNV